MKPHHKTPAAILATSLFALNYRRAIRTIAHYYQGRLTEQGGAPFAPGSYGIQFRLWDSLSGQNPAGLIWAQQQNVALQANGVFNVILGASGGSAIPGTTPSVNDLAFAFSSSSRYL